MASKEASDAVIGTILLMGTGALVAVLLMGTGAWLF